MQHRTQRAHQAPKAAKICNLTDPQANRIPIVKTFNNNVNEYLLLKRPPRVEFLVHLYKTVSDAYLR